MKIHFEPKDFLRKFKIVASVAPVMDVNPTLCNVKIVADKRFGAVLMATDTGLGIRIRVDADVSKSGEALLPPKQFRQILESAKDDRLTLETTKNGILVTGKHDGNEQWGLDTLPPDEFPTVDEFTETAYHEIPAKTLSEMIRRTMFAIDTEDSRSALGGVCVEHDGNSITAVATDGRRLAAQNADGCCVNGHEFVPAILPVNALKLLTKVLKEKSVGNADVKIAVNAVVDKDGRTSGTVHFLCGGVTIFSRLMVGRFPKWRTIMPETDGRLHAKVRCKTLRTALDRMVTTKLEPGILFTFRRGSLTLASRAKEHRQSKMAIPVAFNGTAEFVLDVSFMRDCLRTLDADTSIDIYMAVDNDPVLFEIGNGNYRYLVMPMSRDKSEIAEPEADTGIEVVGQVSTEEESMKKVDGAPIPDNDMETKVFQLLQEKEQLQAKAEQYRVLLDRAMLVIERMKNEQRVCV